MCDCGHPFDPHILIAYNAFSDGGLMFCQELRSCDCVCTWDAPQIGRLNRVMPPQYVVDFYRELLIRQLDEEGGS